MKKKILIISKSFYPEISPRAFRATELAKELALQGNEVALLTAESNYDYSDFQKKYPIIIKSFGRLNCKYIGPSSLPLIGYCKKRIGRLMSLLFNYPDIELVWRLRNALKTENGYDLMISIAAPHSVHWGVAWVRTNKHSIARTWVADCGDPYMGSTLVSFRPPFYFACIEKWFCRKADYITIPVAGAISGYYREFHSKIRIIPQGLSFEGLPQKRIPKTLRPTFAYAGGVATAGVRCPAKFIEYLLSLNKDFEFHVFSAQAKSLLKSYADRSEGKLILHDLLDREELLEELATMDFLVNLDNGTERQVPSKLIDYSLTGRPILSITPHNPEIELINEFLSGEYRNAKIIKNIENYNIQNVAKSFLDLAAS